MESSEGIPPVTNLKTPQVVEMDPILQRVRPIEGTFNPDEEVQKLLSVPTEQRREAVSVFRDKLMRQRKAWALCRTTIEERVEANPDIPREEMVGIIGQFASSYGFAKPHTKIAEQLIDDYISQHKRVVEIRKKYPDDIALINRLTGMKFTGADAGDFTVRVGPMSLEIFCSRLNTARIHKKLTGRVAEDDNTGFAAQSGGREPIYFLVVNNNYAREHPDFYPTILPHEKEHLKSHILAPRLYSTSEVRADVREMLNQGVLGFLRHQVGERLFGFERDFLNELWGRYASTEAPDKKAFLLGELMRLMREDALNRAKDEIIAIMAAKVSPLLPQYVNDTFSQQGGVYDYLAPIRDYDKKKADPLWQETSKRVLVDEYRDIIDKAITASNSLRINGYSPEEIIAILSDKRLPDWPKTVRRLLKAEKSQN